MSSITPRPFQNDLKLRADIACLGIGWLASANAPDFTEGQRESFPILADLLSSAIHHTKPVFTWELCDAIGACVTSYKTPDIRTPDISRPINELIVPSLMKRGPYEPFGHHVIVTSVFINWGARLIVLQMCREKEYQSEIKKKRIDSLEELHNTIDFIINAKIDYEDCATRLRINPQLNGLINSFCQEICLPSAPPFEFRFPVIGVDQPPGSSAEILPFRRLADGK